MHFRRQRRVQRFKVTLLSSRHLADARNIGMGLHSFPYSIKSVKRHGEKRAGAYHDARNTLWAYTGSRTAGSCDYGLADGESSRHKWTQKVFAEERAALAQLVERLIRNQ